MCPGNHLATGQGHYELYELNNQTPRAIALAPSAAVSFARSRRNIIGFLTTATFVLIVFALVIVWLISYVRREAKDMLTLTIVFQCVIFNALPVLVIGTNRLIREWLGRKLEIFLVNHKPFENSRSPPRV